MKKNTILIFVLLFLYSCGNKQLPADFLGTYHGVQSGYFMKNIYGDDVIINGQKLAVPSCDYKFLFEENGIVKLQHTSLKDNTRDYYEGKYSIISQENDKYKLKCTVRSGSVSSPSYLITINKDKKAICQPDGKTEEPEFNLNKIN